MDKDDMFKEIAENDDTDFLNSQNIILTLIMMGKEGC